ncbi:MULTISPECIES: DUF72 domain-containing protein [Pseudomonas]|uniref:DUF72 domain-containing protein n=7 Tax=Pseudomonas TaxID=286 RepID=A0AAJ4E422_PSESX|nr:MULTISPECIES: DUF72 domain-containing protein [Pseudomonas]MCW6056747.1 DUF72 domain-containing protein [Pseudomonas fragi]AVB25860.1 DUF72 domain-containing protein [Pseudomonas syringae pv. syringae]EGH73226.1 hypothetical protein PSYAR_21997 [Pseudomonas syringae pv. aceris str. M302273]KOG02591.1 Uncharacterized protein ABJ98_5328 [Pseudomonas syringae pv. aceris]KPB30714.1 Uncharacterized protein AC518_2356 [Pseudomonas syringae pv. syringae]
MPPVYIGCAGWSLAREYWPDFPEQGSHLQRYASRFNAVEINSSFYRPHRAQTYARWAQAVPAGFRFSVKMPKLITHEHRLRECETVLTTFLSQCTALGDKLGCLLVQLPPSLDYAPQVAERFFRALRNQYAGSVVLEPRHESWRQAQALLIEHHIAQVAADPSVISEGHLPGGWQGAHYWRLHGAPKIYHSAYSVEHLEGLAGRASASVAREIETWCIFDNTASGAAVRDALALQALVERNRAG